MIVNRRGALSSYLPNGETDRIDDSRLDDFTASEHAPCDSNRLFIVVIGFIIFALADA